MQTYYALVQQEGDSAFGITFPDLVGCFSASDSEHDVLPMAHEALSLYVEEADAVPKARSIAELRADADIRQALAAGAFLIAVPLVESSRKSRYNVVLETSLVRGIDEVARAAGMSRSEFLSQAASESLRDTFGAVLTRSRISQATKTKGASTQKASKAGTKAPAKKAAAR
jgi:predicted RNase H-like HicB family nuclease